MGQAKSRGTREERRRQALDKHGPVPIEQVRAEFGLPESAEWLGYVVHLPESDEFLAHSKNTAMAALWGWAKTPLLAHRFDDFQAARKAAKDYGKGGVVVALLFDVGDKLYVAWS